MSIVLHFMANSTILNVQVYFICIRKKGVLTNGYFMQNSQASLYHIPVPIRNLITTEGGEYAQKRDTWSNTVNRSLIWTFFVESKKKKSFEFLKYLN